MAQNSNGEMKKAANLSFLSTILWWKIVWKKFPLLSRRLAVPSATLTRDRHSAVISIFTVYYCVKQRSSE